MHIITLLRHGESVGNANGQIQGQSDHLLTELGRQQASDLAQMWLTEKRNFDWIISSPLSRTRQTAEIIAGALGISYELDPDWKERGFGDFEGKSFEEIMQENPYLDFNHPYLRPGGSGESLIDTFHRAGDALQRLLQRPSGAYLVISHGAFLNMMLYAILGLSPHSSPRSPRFVFSNTGFVDITYNPDIPQWRFHRFWNISNSFG